jgi:hypothetical protein
MPVLALPRPKTLQQDHRCRQPRSSLPSSKDYPCPRLRQTSPLHRTSTRSFQYPARLYRPCSSLPYMRRRMHPHTHTKSGTPTSTPTRIGNTAQTHTKNSQKCTLARRTRGALTYETVGAATPWRREQRISAMRASKRRPSTRCKHRGKLRLDLAALRLLRVASGEWRFRWAAVCDAKIVHPWRYSYQVRIRRNMNHVQAHTRDHDCPPLTTVFNLMMFST